ncbi:flagellar hook-associated protein FlgK [Bacillus luteolus]|uniref:Flagellar hook-associated protein 1 n=1 Tax=Litchfieldia luteola TaxID=682179 RepID=A0ABR9QEY9_9BACI|nr:flagellar hook-associated protein FlgK [Cytobacillus luteolus]MBE4907055.1 flagellar hook-associated protein FlgK [Cytobacillus luteolus]MBP1943478.1 flagellar hook-associated protein 1 FlgK [Cytobacillus luteolus]
MRSTFHGLETARRGMFTQQGALHTTGHNIANANTPGYTRQRVNFVQTSPYPTAAMNRPQIPGQMGTGVEAGTVQRIRESFLDVQYRNENNKVGYYESRSNALQKMEEIMNEPSEAGLSVTLDRFWQSLQDLAVNPSNAGARSVVRQRGIAVAETFNYLSSSLTGIQKDLKNEITAVGTEVNSIARQIHTINKQIGDIEPHGYLPNDLYDERDRLLDSLSKLVNIKVTPEASGGNSLNIAEGKFKVDIVDAAGNSIATLVDPAAADINELQVNYNSNGLVDSVTVGGTTVPLDSKAGSLTSLIHSYGYMDNGQEKGLYPDMLRDLDEMAFEFSKEFNRVHSDGWNITSINSDPQTHTGSNFFAYDSNVASPTDTNKKGAASALILSTDIKNSLDNIAAASAPQTGNKAFLGDGSNAIALAEVKNKNLTLGGNSTNLQNYYEGMIGEMAVLSQEARRITNNSVVLRESVENRRQSVSGVSLDEEMTNMIKFQHAYNASARMITVTDEMLDKIINGMGVVGR